MELDDVRREVRKGLGALGIDDEFFGLKYDISNNKLGLCKDCKHLQMAKTEFGNTFANCYDLDIKLSAEDPVVECTNYEKRGTMSIFEMERIAYIIETDKRKAGFIDGDEETN